MKKVILVFLAVLFLSACSGDREKTAYDYLFVGDGEQWKAVLDYEAIEERGKDSAGVNIYHSEDSYTFTLTYKGDLEKFASIDRLTYEYKRGTIGSGHASMTFDESPTSVSFTSRGGGTGAIMREDMVVEVYVKWDNEEEYFELNLEE